MESLDKICNSDSGPGYVRQPHNILLNNRRYNVATNGHYIVLRERLTGCPEYPEVSLKGRVSLMAVLGILETDLKIQATVSTEKLFQLFGKGEWETECDRCDGTGDIEIDCNYCSGHEVTCCKCDGEGSTSTPHKPVWFLGCVFQKPYLAQILSTIPEGIESVDLMIHNYEAPKGSHKMTGGNQIIFSTPSWKAICMAMNYKKDDLHAKEFPRLEIESTTEEVV